MPSERQIWVVPFFGQGHLFPCMELCKHIASRNFKTTFVISSNLPSSIPSSFPDYPLIEVAQIPSPPPTPPPEVNPSPPHGHNHHSDLAQGIATLEHAMWKAGVVDIKPGDTLLLPGLPKEMALTCSDLKHGPPPGPPPGVGGIGFPPPPQGPPQPPPQPGGQPPWMDAAKDSVALMLNSCYDLEGPFLDYLGIQMGKPVWGVGPLLPQQLWKTSDSLLQDLLYVSFGSEVSPTKRELEQLSDALEASTRPFVWVIQHGPSRPGPPPGPPGNQPGSSYFPHGLDQKVGERGLVIHGWAPQLLILSHGSTGGFLSHCGWNSTVEAIGRGVPLLAWPIRGDQHSNAKLVVNHLKVGCMISDDLYQQNIKADHIGKGIEKLMGNEELKRQALMLSTKFHQGFPSSSAVSLDAFKDLFVSLNAD
ncbi:hypothetical protein F3Y22_tig00110469pilonHSYRG00068 [Hibiscus syriacus]|uniref:Glycosyltransferase n=1 Tax=Hibiscus syriacus TaxID=106335 RepID=A0A6A3AI13_HIBSY|nr:hypothetical protein F3Y22_tig00110469pilonHSYRG00068 [Hibiscus syriacus]